MEQDSRPVVVAFDGSPEAQAAVRAAADLFGTRVLLIASVWEPGFALAAMTAPDPMGVNLPPPSPEDIDLVESAEREHAQATAQAGVRLAGDAGVRAEALPVRDDADVATVVVRMAEQHDAAAIVVGSRGLGAVRAGVLGSTSRRLLHDARRPVLVVRTTDPDD